MIKIIKGVYGHEVGKQVIGVTEKDAPITLSPEQEERLVRLGVAEYAAGGRKNEEELMGMKMPDLKEYAKQHGVKFSVGEKKEDVVRNVLKAYEGPGGTREDAEPDVEEDDLETEDLSEDEIPTFNAEQAVR